MPAIDEGQQDGRAGVERGGVAGAHEDAGADDAADAEEDEVPGAERALAARWSRSRVDLVDGLAQEDARQEAPRSGTAMDIPLDPLLAWRGA